MEQSVRAALKKLSAAVLTQPVDKNTSTSSALINVLLHFLFLSLVGNHLTVKCETPAKESHSAAFLGLKEASKFTGFLSIRVYSFIRTKCQGARVDHDHHFNKRSLTLA